ncbi:MAG: nitrophenyl compound nitroreductase subunit ArsF family protein [Chitinispirillaceae bacterium]
MNLRTVFSRKNAVAFTAVMALTGTIFSCQSSEKKGSESQKEAQTETAETETKAAPKKASEENSTVTTVYYFHTTMRCRSCNLIEEFTKKSLKENFPEQIKSGRLVIKTINIDKEENKHFVKDYKLHTKSVIVSDTKGDEEKRWKNLDQVWMLLRDQNKFNEYIRTEVGNYLKG